MTGRKFKVGDTVRVTKRAPKSYQRSGTHRVQRVGSWNFYDRKRVVYTIAGYSYLAEELTLVKRAK